MFQFFTNTQTIHPAELIYWTFLAFTKVIANAAQIQSIYTIFILLSSFHFFTLLDKHNLKLFYKILSKKIIPA